MSRQRSSKRDWRVEAVVRAEPILLPYQQPPASPIAGGIAIGQRLETKLTQHSMSHLHENEVEHHLVIQMVHHSI